MRFQRICKRVLSDGSVASMFPFHACTKGLEDRVIFRDEDDLRTGYNLIPICARRANVIVVSECVLSTHLHTMILARSYSDAERFIESVKRSASKILAEKYGPGPLYFHGIEARPIYLEDNTHVRNTLCYIPRNSLDMGIKVDEYRWSSYKAMFSQKKPCPSARKVSDMTTRETRAIFKVGDILKDVPWMITEDGRIEPESFCDIRYAEEAFNNDLSYFTKILGLTDDDQMEEMLVRKPTRLMTAEELMKEIEVEGLRRYGIGASLLTRSQKIPLVKRIYYSSRVTPAQLARCFGLSLEDIKTILNR